MSLRTFGSIALVIVAITMVYWYCGSSSQGAIDPRVVAEFDRDLKPIIEKLSSTTGDNRGQVWGELRTVMDGMPEEKRDQMWQLMRQDGERRDEERL
ncbi:MAG: hypothetical protein JNM18_27215, partial [Planctomycetaceae bacterium]|nr:hypothetical protein [Planctomycetaceae bacterium]